MEINHCWIIWYILFLYYKINKRNPQENSLVQNWLHGDKTEQWEKQTQDAKFNLGEQNKRCAHDTGT